MTEISKGLHNKPATSCITHKHKHIHSNSLTGEDNYWIAAKISETWVEMIPILAAFLQFLSAV